MHKKINLLKTNSLLLLLLIYLFNWAHATEPNFKLTIATTVPPITNIVENIAGTHASVQGIVPNGVDSHTFEPVPTDAKVLADANIIFVNGLDLELPTIKLAEKIKKPTTPIVSLGNNTLQEDEWQYDFSFPRERGHPNPHLWLNIALTMKYATTIRDSLIKSDPQHKKSYATNTKIYLDKLQQLDKAIFNCIGTIPKNNRKLVTYHDSFAYFAPRYGMKVVAAIQPASFTELGPQDAIHIIDQIKHEKIPAIFGSEVFPSKVMEQIARESGARFIDELSDDALPDKPNDSFIGMMVKNMVIMTRALGGNYSCVSNIDTRNLIP